MQTFGPQKSAARKETMLNDCLVFTVQRCRRSLMAVHFDEVWDDAGCNRMCDTCRRAAPGSPYCDSTCRSTILLPNKPSLTVESLFTFLLELLPPFTWKTWRHKTSRRRPGRWCRSWRWPPPWRRSSLLWSCWTPGWAKVQPRGGRWSRPPGCRGCRLSKSLCICYCTTTSGTSGPHLFGMFVFFLPKGISSSQSVDFPLKISTLFSRFFEISTLTLFTKF